MGNKSATENQISSGNCSSNFMYLIVKGTGLLRNGCFSTNIDCMLALCLSLCRALGQPGEC